MSGKCWEVNFNNWRGAEQDCASCRKVKSCVLLLLRYLSINLKFESLSMSQNALLPPRTDEQRACFALSDKICVLTSISWKDSFHIFTCWGSDCFKFHHVLAFTLTESLMGPGKKVCVLQLIICSKCRACPSFMRLFHGTTFCLSVYLFIYRISCVYCWVLAQTVPSVLLTKIGCICLAWRRAGRKREERWKDMKESRRGEGRRWEGNMSEKKMKTVRVHWGFCHC